MITCQLNEHSNHLGIFEEHCTYPSVVIPNDSIDDFISALQEHMSSEGDGETFTMDFTSGRNSPFALNPLARFSDEQIHSEAIRRRYEYVEDCKPLEE